MVTGIPAWEVQILIDLVGKSSVMYLSHLFFGGISNLMEDMEVLYSKFHEFPMNSCIFWIGVISWSL